MGLTFLRMVSAEAQVWGLDRVSAYYGNSRLVLLMHRGSGRSQEIVGSIERELKGRGFGEPWKILEPGWHSWRIFSR